LRGFRDLERVDSSLVEKRLKKKTNPVLTLPDPYPLPLRPTVSKSWPQSWLDSYQYDRLEVWGERFDRGFQWSYLSRRQATIEAILKSHPPPGRVLDLAAAQGNFSIALAQLGYQVTWNDLRSELIDYVRLKLPVGLQIEFLAGNVFELQASRSLSYDVVLATEIIEHVAHPDEFLLKLSSLVRPEGIVVISTPNGGYLLNKIPRFSEHPDPSVFESIQFKPGSEGHIFLLYVDEIVRFAQVSGLTVEHLNLITAGHMKLRYLHKILPDAVIIWLEELTRKLPQSVLHHAAVQTIAVLARRTRDPDN
jgi:2-polyprenyl-3-methyl-5-hydroxy-6-metoxy-1,4-benzoquinol methylase